MARWEPDAPGRLERTALDLFVERGYAATTVGDIAAAAGVTARTYFRYFPDKREVLFGGAAQLQEAVVARLQGAPADLAPLAAVMEGARAASEVMRPREFLVRRAAVIASAPELQEREAAKLSALSAALTSALEQRGEEPGVALLAADTGMALMRAASTAWVGDESLSFDAALALAARRFAAIGAPTPAST